MTTDLERIKEKIRALKRLAQNEAASVGEVGNAMQLAKKLCRDYNLVLSEIDETQQIKEIKESIKEKKIEVKHSRYNAARSMNTAICRLYEVETFFSWDNEYQTLIGLESDIELAVFAMDVAHNAMDAGWKKYMNTDEYEDYIDEGFRRSAIRRDYSKGFALKVIELVHAMERDKEALKEIQTSKCTALIVRKEAEINEYKAQNYPNLRSSRSRIQIQLTGAKRAGEEDGSRVRFNQAISASSDDRLKLRG